MSLTRIVTSFAAILLLTTACASTAIPHSSTNDEPMFGRSTSAYAKANVEQTVYVLNYETVSELGTYDLSVFSNYGRKYLRTLSLGYAVSGAGAFAVAPSGELYATIGAREPTVNVYSSGGTKLERTLTQKRPFGLLTFDAAGNLFTKCFNGRFVCEYAGGAKRITRKIPTAKLGLSYYHELSTDANGDLAVAGTRGSSSTIMVFAPGAIEPYWTIGGLKMSQEPKTAEFDASGDLYVLDANGIEIYSPAQTSPSRTITAGLTTPTQLALDGSGNLYVLGPCFNERSACQYPPSVTVYAPGESSPSRTIGQGLIPNASLDMAVDAAGYLAVSNGGAPSQSGSGAGSVIIVKPGAKNPRRTLRANAHNPLGVLFGP